MVHVALWQIQSVEKGVKQGDYQILNSLSQIWTGCELPQKTPLCNDLHVLMIWLLHLLFEKSVLGYSTDARAKLITIHENDFPHDHMKCTTHH